MSPRTTAVALPAPEARIQSIARAKAILDVLASGDGGWILLRDIAAGTGLAKTTAFNLTTALVEVGLVEHNPAQGSYRLGVELIAYGRAVERRTDLLGFMRPYLVKLCAVTRETVNLALPCPMDVIIVESLEGSQSLRITSYAGTRASYHSTACGRALLAYGTDATRRQVLGFHPLVPLTPHTTIDPDRLDAILAQCRQRGFVEEVEENEEGAACVGAALLDGKGDAVAAVSIAGPLTRMGPETRERVGRLLVETLEEARQALLTAPHH
ncbi:IclR family transcriptional regulator [uncultured Alsobacter sp.]|uniref:IclR family transcriptional regulator n=1 Tax=uncultured Alsobacter sp. TaxID=1748258 RepID=UPI002600B70C|nr:IclR family transcriptional regulator [uncultured Alsobacter sp.]